MKPPNESTLDCHGEVAGGNQKVSLELGVEEALVLFDWLKRFNEKEHQDFEDQSEERILWDLEALLERSLAAPFSNDYDEILQAAREKIRDRTE